MFSIIVLLCNDLYGVGFRIEVDRTAIVDQWIPAPELVHLQQCRNRFYVSEEQNQQANQARITRPHMPHKLYKFEI